MNVNRISFVVITLIALLMLSQSLVVSTVAQDRADIVWQANNAGNAVAFSSDGQLVLSGLRLWRASSGALIRTFKLPYNGGGVTADALSPDGQYAAIGIQAYNQNLNLFRTSDGALVVGRITAHTNGTTSLAFSPDGQLLASGGRDGTAKIWHMPDMRLLRTLNVNAGYRSRVFAVAFSESGQTVAVGGTRGVQIFRVSDGALVRPLDGAPSTSALAASPDGQVLASASNARDQYGQCIDCSIKLWRVTDGALLETIDAGNNTLTSVAFSPDQRYITSGSTDSVSNGVVRFWHLPDGTLAKSFNQDPDNAYSYVTAVAYSPTGNLVAFTRADGLIVVARNPFF